MKLSSQEKKLKYHLVLSHLNLKPTLSFNFWHGICS
jgi:hypothetical protein